MTGRECGAALAVTLILLTGLGLLALTAAAAAITALALAGHQQSSQRAFEAAEAGIAHALVLAARAQSDGAIAETVHDGDAGSPAIFQARIERAGIPGALPAGFSIGEHSGAFATESFYVVADGRAGRGTRMRLEQGFYLVVPASGR